MKFVPVLDYADATPFLYELLQERPEQARISHEKMPTREEHEHFVEHHPFRFWFLLEAEGNFVGAMEVTDRNEIGIAILRRYQGRGYASTALRAFIEMLRPLPEIPAVRRGQWLANIAMGNDAGKDFFAKCGFRPVQTTWVLP